MLAANIRLNLFTTVAIQVAGLVGGIIVARDLGPSGRGLVAIAILWSSLGTYIGDLGIPIAFAVLPSRGVVSREMASTAVVPAALILSVPIVAAVLLATGLVFGFATRECH